MREIKSDVLVIGSGGAGLRAAIEAGKTSNVVLVSKGPLGKSGATILAGADIMADGRTLHELGHGEDANDTPESWAREILIQGFHLNDENLVERYVNTAGDRVREMIGWGMSVRDTEPRAVITTGMSICASLRRGMSEVPTGNVRTVQDMMVSDLIVRDGRAIGALGVDFNTGEILRFSAKSIIMATGGWHQAYELNAGSDELTGDGHGMAYRAGAELIEMEMVTFAPNILVAPVRFRGSLWFYVLPGTLLNAHGDAFMSWEDPRVAKLAATTEWNKLLCSKASMREIVAGRGGPNGGVFFSWKGLPSNLFESFERAYPGWRFQGDDFSALMEQVREGYAPEVAPAAEYFEGGIRIDEACRSSIDGLFAAGECSGGLFGANRVAAATTEMVVQGAIAGQEAARDAASVQHTPLDEKHVEDLAANLTRVLEAKGKIRLSEIRRRLRKVAYWKAGVLRTEKGLTEALAEVSELRSSLGEIGLESSAREWNREWMEALELRNMIDCVELSAKAALARTESRGVHVREDYPDVDNIVWRKHLVLTRKDAQDIEVSMVPVKTKTSLPEKRRSYEETIAGAARELLTVQEA